MGKSLGKHKLAPVISPNKTWEGSVGGILASLLAGYLATLYVPDLTIKIAFPVAAIRGLHCGERRDHRARATPANG